MYQLVPYNTLLGLKEKKIFLPICTIFHDLAHCAPPSPSHIRKFFLPFRVRGSIAFSLLMENDDTNDVDVVQKPVVVVVLKHWLAVVSKMLLMVLLPLCNCCWVKAVTVVTTVVVLTAAVVNVNAFTWFCYCLCNTCCC